MHQCVPITRGTILTLINTDPIKPKYLGYMSPLRVLSRIRPNQVKKKATAITCVNTQRTIGYFSSSSLSPGLYVHSSHQYSPSLRIFAYSFSPNNPNALDIPQHSVVCTKNKPSMRLNRKIYDKARRVGPLTIFRNPKLSYFTKLQQVVPTPTLPCPACDQMQRSTMRNYSAWRDALSVVAVPLTLLLIGCLLGYLISYAIEYVIG